MHDPCPVEPVPRLRPYTACVLPPPDRQRDSTGKTTFSFLGFPTSVRPGFWVFLLLLTFLYPYPLGLWVALAVALFTLLHEFGHAWVARRADCVASISLDFMVAYASYRPRRPLTWIERASIALAGPLVQVVSAHLVLLALGANPFSRADIVAGEATIAVWWAGVALGLLNLIPVLPLDGGAIVASIAESFAPKTGRDWVMKFSFAATVIATALALATGWIGLVPLLVFMLMMQWQTLVAPARLHRLLTAGSLEPTGEPDVDQVVIDALLLDNQPARALEFARASYLACPASASAVGAARAAVAAHDLDSAVRWLRVAEKSQVDAGEFRDIVRLTEDLEPLRSHPGASAEWFTHR